MPIIYCKRTGKLAVPREQVLEEESVAVTSCDQSTHHTGVTGLLEVVMQEFGGTILECFRQGTK